MNTQQVENLKQTLTRLEKLDIKEALAKQFPTQDLNGLSFSGMTATQLLSLTERMRVQLLAELEGSNAQFLPPAFHWQTATQGMATRPIDVTINGLEQHLKNHQWDPAVQQLELAIGYQIACGFWSHGERKLHSVSGLRQKEIFTDLETKSLQLSEAVQKAVKTNEQLTGELQRCRNEAPAMEKIAQEARGKAQEITTLLQQASAHQATLQQLVTTQNQNLQSAKAELKALAETKADLEKKLKVAQDQIAVSEAKLKFMQEKETFVNELAGTAAAGVLGQKFEARKQELGRVSAWWLGGMVFALVVAGAWVWFTHSNFHSNNVSVWRELASNFGLLLPALFLLLFVAAQYLKERHFQEEYAFRSAVAMTLKAFADEMVDGSTDRTKLLSETIQRLYQLPSGLTAKEERSTWFTARAAHGVIKEVTELVKEIKK